MIQDHSDHSSSKEPMNPSNEGVGGGKGLLATLGFVIAVSPLKLTAKLLRLGLVWPENILKSPTRRF